MQIGRYLNTGCINKQDKNDRSNSLNPFLSRVISLVEGAIHYKEKVAIYWLQILMGMIMTGTLC